MFAMHHDQERPVYARYLMYTSLGPRALASTITPVLSLIAPGEGRAVVWCPGTGWKVSIFSALFTLKDGAAIGASSGWKRRRGGEWYLPACTPLRTTEGKHAPSYYFGTSLPCLKGLTTFPCIISPPYTQLDTEYRQKFVDKEVLLVLPYRPDRGGDVLPRGSFDPSTTFQQAFKQYDVQRASPFKPLDQPLETGAFRGQSTYSQQFVPKATPYARVGAPSPARPMSAGPFQGASTYKDTFVAFGVPAAPPRAAAPLSQNLSTGPFVGTSMYTSTFIPMANARREAFVPKEGGEVMPKGAFDDATTSRMAYVPKGVARPELCKPLHARPMSAAPFVGSSEYRNNFFGREVCARAALVIPDRGGDLMPKGAFQGATTAGDAFKAYQVAPVRPVIPPTSNALATGLFNGSSTYNDAFINKAVPYSRVKPTSSTYQPNKERFYGETTHNAAFQPYASVPVTKPYQGISSMPHESHPFQGQSTSHTDYIKMHVQQQRFGPAKDAPVSTGPFNGASTYRNDFVQKEIPARVREDCSECSSCAADDEY